MEAQPGPFSTGLSRFCHSVRVLRGSPTEESFKRKGIAGHINPHKYQDTTIRTPKCQDKHAETVPEMIPLTVLFQPSVLT